MTYSIVARDPDTGEMGVATQSQAFAVGASVPFALPGFGVIATQSMAEPMYGSVGLELLRGGFTARMPAARPRLDLFVALVAMGGIAALAISQRAGLEAGHAPGQVLLLTAYAYLAVRIAVLAGRILIRARPSV